MNFFRINTGFFAFDKLNAFNLKDNPVFENYRVKSFVFHNTSGLVNDLLVGVTNITIPEGLLKFAGMPL